MRETQSHTHPPPPGFGISVHAPADPTERPGVRRVKSERRERGGGRSPEKLLEGESSQGQGAHPSSFWQGVSPLHDNEGLVWTSAKGGDSSGTLVAARCSENWERRLLLSHLGDRKGPRDCISLQSVAYFMKGTSVCSKVQCPSPLPSSQHPASQCRRERSCPSGQLKTWDRAEHFLSKYFPRAGTIRLLAKQQTRIDQNKPPSPTHCFALMVPIGIK